jgi:hypothetical protein
MKCVTSPSRGHDGAERMLGWLASDDQRSGDEFKKGLAADAKDLD